MFNIWGIPTVFNLYLSVALSTAIPNKMDAEGVSNTLKWLSISIWAQMNVIHEIFNKEVSKCIHKKHLITINKSENKHKESHE